MPSEVYQKIRDAMEAGHQVHATYGGLHRMLCVHEIGLGPKGNEQILAYQFGGDTSKGPAVEIDDELRWRCMPIEGLSDVEIVEGPWHTGDNRGAGNTCIADTDLAIHPET